ncbi:MAG: hypothetical protein SFW35_06195 [Chitinophagales bacterium]|nr:hypothetical protein [Chitinophagales bacterium]
MDWIFKYWYIFLIIGYYIYSAFKQAQEVNKNRPTIPKNQPDIKPQPQRRLPVEQAKPIAKPTQPPLGKTFEEIMAEMYGEGNQPGGEGYGDSQPFTYSYEPEAKPIAEADKSYKFSDTLVGSLKDRPIPKSMALRGEIGSEDETPERTALAFDPKDAVMYSIILERKYFEI